MSRAYTEWRTRNGLCVLIPNGPPPRGPDPQAQRFSRFVETEDFLTANVVNRRDPDRMLKAVVKRTALRSIAPFTAGSLLMSVSEQIKLSNR